VGFGHRPLPILHVDSSTAQEQQGLCLFFRHSEILERYESCGSPPASILEIAILQMMLGDQLRRLASLFAQSAFETEGVLPLK
jgi:hypothetical protein